MSDLTQLYQDIILGHNKRPRNYGSLDEFTGKVEKNNPLCGDEVTVYWKIKNDQISEITFTAQGCAISRASASIMTDLLVGKTIEEANIVFEKLRLYLSEEPPEGSSMECLGDLVAFSGVRDYPSRVKCAVLPWIAFLES